MLVRLLVLTAVAALALDMMHTYLDGCALGKRVIALASSLDITQGLLRLGSGARIYPRPSCSLRADTLAPTAPPYTYGSDTFLGYAELNTLLQAKILPSGRHGRHGNDGNLDFRVLKERVASSFAGCSLGCSTRVDRLCCTDYHDRHQADTQYVQNTIFITQCEANYVRGERICRIRGRHTFHAPCWQPHTTSNNTCCRGGISGSFSLSALTAASAALPPVTRSLPRMLVMVLVMQPLYWST